MMQKSALPTQTGAPSRGRPRKFDRETALGLAMRLFWMKGYEATSIADLTTALGIGPTSLYAAFGSKEALYAEAIEHYGENYEPLFWADFETAATARDAVRSLLLNSAAVLSGSRIDIPRGCMVALAAVGGEDHAALGELVRSERAVGLGRLKARIERAIAQGELPPSVDAHALARFVQTVQNGMSILARDGASRADLEDVANITLMGWDARVAA